MPDDAVAEAREQRGRRVREVWVKWAREQPSPKPSWLLPWEELDEPSREADRRIGSALWGDGFKEGMEAGFASARTLAEAERAAAAERERVLREALAELLAVQASSKSVTYGPAIERARAAVESRAAPSESVAGGEAT